MAKPVTQHLDEPCHNCGGTYKPAPQATAEQRAKAAYKEDPIPLPPHYDTAPTDVIDDLGPLWRCDGCGSGMRGLTKKADAAGEFKAPRPA